MRTLVIGHGMAAGRLVQQLAEPGEAKLTVVGDEAGTAYNRLLLSSVLAGRQSGADLALRSDGWYDRAGVEVLRGVRATTLDTDAHTVGLEDGTLLDYDRLVLATGSRPDLPTLRGLVAPRGGLLPGAFAFRTVADCEQILAEARPGMRAVVIGGGLLGVEAARGLALRGLGVEIVHQAPHLMERQLDAGAGAALRRTLERLGVTAYLDARAVAVRPGDDGRVAAVRLADSYELDCDLVVFACGIRPATALAQAGGLTVGKGVVVDDRLATSAPDVWAIGECAEHRGVVNGWAQAALDQATVLADVLRGGTSSYDGSTQVTRLRAAGVELAVMGDARADADATTEVLRLSDPVRGTYRKVVVRDGRLVGVLLVGDTSGVGPLTRAFDRGSPLPADLTTLLFPLSSEGRVA